MLSTKEKPEIKVRKKQPGRNTLRLQIRALTYAYLVEREVEKQLALSYVGYVERHR